MPVNGYSEYNHFYIYSRLKQFNVKTVLDMGGRGRSKNRGFDVIDANIKQGIDATKLPFDDNNFDATISIATIEHVGDHQKHKLFIQEAVRVSRIISIHWIPIHSNVEKFLKNLGHKHTCVIPDCDLIVKELNIDSNMIPFTTIKEHLIFLATIYPKLNKPELHNYILNYGHEIYGMILEIKKEIKK